MLYRLSTSPHRDRFVLKGAVLITTWFEDPHRPTRDVDLLGYGDPTPEHMLAVFREICAVKENDGITFDIDALQVELIREELEYGGLRLRTTARLAGQFVSALAAADDSSGEFHPWIERDPSTGARSFKLPLPAPDITRRLADTFSAMVDALRGRDSGR